MYSYSHLVAALAGLAVLASGVRAHDECAYSGVVGAIRYTGSCTLSGSANWNYGAGSCIIPGFEGSYGCDYPYHNSDFSPCGNAAQSQYACKREGDPCYVYNFADDQSLQVYHCSVI